MFWGFFSYLNFPLSYQCVCISQINYLYLNFMSWLFKAFITTLVVFSPSHQQIVNFHLFILSIHEFFYSYSNPEQLPHLFIFKTSYSPLHISLISLLIFSKYFLILIAFLINEHLPTAYLVFSPFQNAAKAPYSSRLETCPCQSNFIFKSDKQVLSSSISISLKNLVLLEYLCFLHISWYAYW